MLNIFVSGTRKAVLLALCCIGAWSASAFGLPPNFQTELVVDDLDNSVYLTQLPDGRMLVGEKLGDIYIFDPAAPAPVTPTLYLSITDVETGGERGLTSIAVDPNFAQNPYIYVYYTNASTSRNRISRFAHVTNTADLNSEMMIWQDNEAWSDCCHYGGGLAFGPDEKLYLTTGEEFDGNQSQDLTRAGGKIIRINSDGSIPIDNPFIDGAGPNLDEIWAVGLRNPYRAYWDLIGNRLFIGEVGSNNNSIAREDIHVASTADAGANFGWPFCEGQCADPSYSDPIFDYGHLPTVGGAVTMGVVYRGNLYPSEYVGDLFFGDYVRDEIRLLNFNPDGSVASDEDFGQFGAQSPVVHVIEGQDGAIYYVNFKGSVHRINYTATNQAPVIISTTVDTAPGPAPVLVNFDVDAEDPEGSPLQYRWFFGDGSDLVGQSVSHNYQSSGPFNVYVQVTDGILTTTSPIEVVQVGNLPQVTISQPSGGLLFRAGELVAFSATATDPDETLTPSAYSWDILLTHNTHTHPALTNFSGQTGDFQINTTGHEYLGNTGYALTVEVTDSDGISATETVQILPDKVDINFETSPISTPLFIDGVSVASPTLYDTLIDFEHVVSVPQEVCSASILYTFDSWSDGGARTHSYVVPDTNSTLTANFVENGACSSIPTSGLVLHLEADSGVTTTGNNLVTQWLDQSIRQNDLVSNVSPSLVPGVLNGQPVIAFDGVDDQLERVSDLMAMPAGNADRSIVMLARYDSTGFGGFAYGNNSCNQAFGAAVDKAGKLTVQGWCTDFKSGTEGTGAGWLRQVITLENGTVNHYKDNLLIDTDSHVYNTLPNSIVLGAEIDGAPHLDMDVAVVMVYDRALTLADRDQIETYLQEKYFSGGGNQPPVAVGDGGSVDEFQSVELNVLANDSDPDGTLDPTQVVITSPALFGSTQVNPVTGAITYTHIGGGLSDSYQYQVADNEGALSNSATVSIQINLSGGGNQAPVANNDVASVELNQVVKTNVVANDTDDVALDPGSVTVLQQPQYGTASVDSVSGVVTYQDVTGTANVDTYTYSVDDDQGITSNIATVTIEIGGERITSGLLALYTFNEGSGSVVSDSSNIGAPLDLIIQDPSNVAWGAGALTINQSTQISSAGAATKVNAAIEASNEITLEARVTPSNLTQSGPARIAGASNGTGKRNITLGQAGTAYNTRMRTTSTNNNASNINLSTPVSSVTTNKQHVVYTRATDGTARFYIDGLEVASAAIPGDTSNWLSNFQFVIANETSGNRPWLGELDLVAVYDRVLTPAEVAQNYVGGSGSFNSAPVAFNDSDTVDEGGTVITDILLNDTDSDGTVSQTTVFIVTQPQNGTVSINPNTGEATYTHNGSQVFSDSYAYHVSDDLGAVSNVATVNLTINDLAGSPPLAVGDFVSGQTGASIEIAILANDSDEDGSLDPTTVNIEVLPDNGDVTVNFTTGVVTYQHDGGLTTGDSFRYTVMDNDARTSNIAVVNITIGSQALPEAGLVLRLEPDAGIALGAGNVITSWNDISGSNNHLTAVGDPTLVAGALNGLPAVDLDGSGDRLERIGNVAGLPAGNSDRTVVLLANYQGNGYGGFSYGTNSCRQNFGAVVSPAGNLALQGWCTDFETAENATSAGWIIQSILVDNGQAEHYRNASLIATNNVDSFNTSLAQIRVGSQINGSPFVDMQIGAVLVYDRILTGTEFTQVQSYLQAKYIGAASNQAPVALNDSDTTSEGESVTTDVLANDMDPEGLLDLTSVSVISGPSNGTVDIDGTTGQITYTNTNTSATASDIYEYQVSDTLGAASNTATVTITIAPNQLPVGVNDFAFVVAGQTVDIDVSSNDSDPDGTLDLGSVNIVQQPSNGTLTVNSTTGVVSYTQDIGIASDDLFTYEIQDDAGATSDETIVALRIGSTSLPTAGLVLQLEADSGVQQNLSGDVTSWVDQTLHANDLTAGAGEPAYLQGVLNGMPVVSFDGTDDVLERVGSINSLPAANDDRTVILMSNYLANTGYGGFAYGNSSCRQAFGTVVAPNGNLTLQGWCTDFDSGTAGTGQGWLVQAVTMTSGQIEHYLDGGLIGTHDASNFNTVLNRITLGAEIDGSPSLAMQVTAVLVYNSALTAVELADVTTYLQEKYLAVGGNMAPLAVDDSDTAPFGSGVTTDILLNDTDPDNAIDPGSVQIITEPANGDLSIDDNTGFVTYNHNGSATSTDSYQYQVADVFGLSSNTATVSLAITGAPNDPPVAVADTASVAIGGSIDIDILANDSDSDGAIDPTTVLITSIPVRGTYFLNATTGVVTYTHDGSATTSDTIEYEVMDDQAASSNIATVTLNIGDSILPNNGLVLQLETDQGITTGSNSAVFGWEDQSPSQNDLIASGSPTLIAGALNGQDVISFDGIDDRLQRQGLPITLPAGNSDRAVFVVASYQGTGYGGFAYGTSSCRQTFGTVVSPNGNLALQGWCTDFESSTPATGQGFLVQSVVVAGGQATHYMGDSVIGTHSVANFNTSLANIVVGAEIDGSPFTDMQIAAVIVYDRAVSTQEFAQVQSYLGNKYFASGGNQTPIAVEDLDSVVFNGSVTTDVLVNDFDNDGLIQPGTTEVTSAPLHGTTSVNLSTGEITYTHNGVSTSPSDSYQYRVQDDAAGLSNAATVTLSITGVPNQPPVAVDDDVILMSGDAIAVSVLANDSDVDGSIDPSTLFIVQGPTNGSYLVSGGVITYTHNGTLTTTDSIIYNVMDDDFATSNDATLNITIGDSVLPQLGLVMHLEADSGVVTTTGNNISNWADQSVNGNDLVSISTPTLVQGALNGRPVVDFDGVGDRMQRISNVVGLPIGAQDRTVMILVNYRDDGFGGFAYGSSSCRQAFGTVVAPNGNLAIQGWCTDHISNEPGNGSGWIVQTAIMSSGQVEHFQGVNSIGAHDVTNFNTTLGRITVGAELDGAPTVDMQLAVALVYNKALNSTEFDQAYDYLQAKYFGVGGNLAPTANDDSDETVIGSSAITDVLANDSDLDGTVDATTVAIVSQPSAGTLSINPTTGEISYSHTGTVQIFDSYQYTVADDSGLASNTATVTINVGIPNQPPETNSDSGFVDVGQSVTIDVLVNDTDTDGAIDPSTVQVSTLPLHGSILVNQPVGTITYTHDASTNLNDSYEYTVQDEDADTSQPATVSITALLPRVTSGLQALYRFNEGAGAAVSDTSGVGTPLELVIADISRVTWNTGSITLNQSTKISSPAAATKLSNAIPNAEAITVEAWIAPANLTQTGPARIVSLSQGTGKRNFTLGQGPSGASADQYDMRLRTTVTGKNGSNPTLPSGAGTLTTALTHVVYTRDASGNATFYVDNIPVSVGSIDGSLSNWDTNFQLVLGNESTSTRPWLGTIDLVAVYDKALSAAEVAQNFSAGAQ